MRAASLARPWLGAVIWTNKRPAAIPRIAVRVPVAGAGSLAGSRNRGLDTRLPGRLGDVEDAAGHRRRAASPDKPKHVPGHARDR
jgi:hypothetical protein